MDLEFEKQWKDTLTALSRSFGEELDLQAVLFLIGVQELGQGAKKFSKDQKVDLMHIAICTLLEPYGYYTYAGRDGDGWPHFERNEKLPFLPAKEQELLMKNAIIQYFEQGDV